METLCQYFNFEMGKKSTAKAIRNIYAYAKDIERFTTETSDSAAFLAFICKFEIDFDNFLMQSVTQNRFSKEKLFR